MCLYFYISFEVETINSIDGFSSTQCSCSFKYWILVPFLWLLIHILTIFSLLLATCISYSRYKYSNVIISDMMIHKSFEFMIAITWNERMIVNLFATRTIVTHHIPKAGVCIFISFLTCTPLSFSQTTFLFNIAIYFFLQSLDVRYLSTECIVFIENIIHKT